MRKQIRHIENFLKYPRTLPQIKQRWYFLTANLGSRNAFAISDFLATFFPLSYVGASPMLGCACASPMPPRPYPRSDWQSQLLALGR